MRLFFGGTFDPFHLGHRALLNEALEHGPPVEDVVVMPCGRQPLKTVAPVATAAQRLVMAELALLDEPRATVSAMEIMRPGPSFTIDTLEELGGEEWLILVGADALPHLPQWHGTSKLAKKARFLVASRDSLPLTAPKGVEVTTLADFHHPASATAIRRGDGHPSWLHPLVRTYLHKYNPYGSVDV